MPIDQNTLAVCVRVRVHNVFNMSMGVRATAAASSLVHLGIIGVPPDNRSAPAAPKCAAIFMS